MFIKYQNKKRMDFKAILKVLHFIFLIFKKFIYLFLFLIKK